MRERENRMTTKAATRTNGVKSPTVTDEALTEAFGPEISAPVSAPPAPDVKPFWTVPPMAKPEMPYIYAAMNAAMQEIRAVGKDGYNEQQRYNFRGIDGVVDAAGPAFRKHGIIPSPKLLQVDYRDTKTTGGKDTREVVVRVLYTFTALDGSSVEAEVPGESLDQSDKGTAKAMSVAYRIALLQMLAIPTQEKDPDADYHTRDGQGAMSAPVTRFILNKVEHGPLESLPELWQIVLDHSAADRVAVTDDTGSSSWQEVFGARWAAEIAAIDTFEDGKVVYEAAKQADVLGWRVGNTTVGGLLKARSAHLTERAGKAATAVVDALEAAGNVEQVEAVNTMLIEYAASKHIPAPNAADLHQRIEDKRAALEAAAAEAGESTTA